MANVLKLAKDLVPGDRIVIRTSSDQNAPVTVLAIVESETVVRRKVLATTVRDTNGEQFERRFYANDTIRMLPQQEEP